jgi:hypothetical protein
VLQGQKACNDAGVLDPDGSGFSCMNPFYAEPLCDSACVINSLLTMVAAWFAKQETADAAPASRSSYSSTNTKVRCLRVRATLPPARHALTHESRSRTRITVRNHQYK